MEAGGTARWIVDRRDWLVRPEASVVVSGSGGSLSARSPSAAVGDSSDSGIVTQEDASGGCRAIPMGVI